MKRLTDSEKQFILKNYNSFNTIISLANSLNLHADTVGKFLKRNGLEVDFSQELKEKIINWYIQDRFSSSKIKELTGISCHYILKILKDSKCKIRNASERLKRFHCNSTFFQQIDSPIKAQVLGFIAADGCVSNKSLIISIIHTDHNYLVNIKNNLNYTGEVRVNKNNGGFSKPETLMSRLCISDQTIVNNLNQYGICPRKSLILKFPDLSLIPKEFIGNYFLGYFEGDGSISINKKTNRCQLSFTGTKDFCGGLKEYLKNQFNMNSSLIPVSNSNSGICHLFIGGNQKILQLYEWFYKGVTFNLERKHNKFLYLKDLYKDGIIKGRKRYEMFTQIHIE